MGGTIPHPFSGIPPTPCRWTHDWQLKNGYAIVIEQAAGNLSAYVPDLPGCVAVGKSVAEVKRLIAEAIDIHLEGLKLSGSPIPEPTSIAEYVEAHSPVG